MSFWRKWGKLLFFKRTSCYNNSENLCSEQLSPKLSSTFQPWSTAETYAVFWTGREKMDWRQFCRRFKYISRKRQMIHHTSNSGYRHNCESSSTAQAIRLIKRDQDDINSENQRVEKIFGAVSSGGKLKLSSIQSPNQNLQLETCMKEQPGKGSWKRPGSSPAPEEQLMPSVPKIKLSIHCTL